jgi:hypothetical protein
MEMGRSCLVAAAAPVLQGAGSAQAALVDRGGGMVYDDVQNITWLQNWNTNSAQSWEEANQWAGSLSHGGYDDWRLPTALNSDGTGPCGGPGCSGSEMGYMFYNYFGGNAGQSVLDQSGDTAEEIANLALFTHVGATFYWTGTALNATSAWIFATYDGTQYTNPQSLALYAVAVRDGDVAATGAVPEPATALLALLGLGALAATRTKGRNRFR